MEPSRKKHDRLSRKEQNDRLSSLDNDTLSHIISLMDTKAAIRSSLLSKRYRFLWTLSPCLDFSFSDHQTVQFESETLSPCMDFSFSDQFESDDSFALSPNSSFASFKDSVDRVLQLRKGNLLKFRLSLQKDDGSPFMDHCIQYADHHKVQHLKVKGSVQNPVALPDSLLNSPFLVSLNLHNGTKNSIEMPKLGSLPNLNLLCLKNFEFCDRNFNGEFFSGCPNLQTLILCRCLIRPKPVNKLRVLDVKCFNLLNLEIKYWRGPWRKFEEQLINVHTPKLVSFLFKGHLARVNFDCGLPVVEKATIDLSSYSFFMKNNERKGKILAGLFGMLQHMSSVSFLSLSLRTLEFMAEPTDLQGRAPMIFENLKRIRITTSASFKYVELEMRVDAVKLLLERVANDLIFEASKENKLLPECSKAKKKESRNIAIPAHVILFLLQSSPSLELFVVEIPKTELENLEDGLQALLSDKSGEAEYVQTLEHQIMRLKEFSHS